MKFEVYSGNRDMENSIKVFSELPKPEDGCVELESLESIARAYLTDLVNRGFPGSMIAMRQIKEQKLYHKRFLVFEDYCQFLWNTTERNANCFIKAAGIAVEDLKSEQFVPSSYQQTKPLMKDLSPEQRREIWRKAIAIAGGRPNEKHVKEAKKQFLEYAKKVPSIDSEVGELTVELLDTTSGPVGFSSSSRKPLEGIVGYSYPGSLIKWHYMGKIFPFLAKTIIEHIRQHRLESASFVYQDIFAGPGDYRDAKDKRFVDKIGSPLIALQTLVPWFLNERDIDFVVNLNEPNFYFELYRSIEERGYRIGKGNCIKDLTVGARDCSILISKLINDAKQYPPQFWETVFGVALFDPGPELLPWESIGRYANCSSFKNMELLFHVNVNCERRVFRRDVKAYPEKTRLGTTDWLQQMNRPHIYVTAPARGAGNFTMVLCSNFEKVEELRKLGFYHIFGTPEGREYFQNMDCNFVKRKRK